MGHQAVHLFYVILRESEIRIVIRSRLWTREAEIYIITGVDRALIIGIHGCSRIDGRGVFYIFRLVRTPNCDPSVPKNL